MFKRHIRIHHHDIKTTTSMFTLLIALLMLSYAQSSQAAEMATEQAIQKTEHKTIEVNGNTRMAYATSN